MSWLPNLRLRAKLLGAFGLIVVLLLALTASAHRATVADQRATDEVSDVLAEIALANEALLGLVTMETGYRGFLLTGRAEELERYDAGKADADRLLERLVARDDAGRPQAHSWATIARLSERWRREVAEPGIALRRRVNLGEAPLADVAAWASTAGGEPRFDAIRAAFDDALAENARALAVRGAERDRADRRERRILLFGTSAAIAVAAAVALLLARDILRAVEAMAQGAREMARGNLDRRIGLRRRDELGETAGALDEMAARLQTLVQEMNRAVQAARAGETRARAVMDSVGDGIFTVDERGRLVSFNRAAERIFGYRAAEAIGRPVSTLIPEAAPSDGEVAAGGLAALGAHREVVGRRAAGQTFPLDLVVSEVRLDGERQTIGVARDVTERKRAGRRLRESEERLRLALDAAGMGTWEWRAGADGPLWSDQVKLLHGLAPAADAAGAELLAAIHPDDRDRVVAELARALASGSDCEVAYRAVLPAGGARWIAAKGRVVGDGEPGGSRLIGVATDVTARTRAEEELRASEGRYRELFAAARRQAQDLELLDKVRTALARELDLADVIRTVVEAIPTTFGYTQVSLYLVEDGELTLQHQVGYDRVLPRIPLDQGVAGRVARTGESVLIRDVGTDPAFLGAIEGIESEVCVPLRDEGRVVGVLNVESVGGVALGDEDLRLVTSVAEHVELAIARSRLFAAARESEARFAAFMDNSPALAWMKDEALRYRYLSRPYERLIMQRSEDVAGKDDFALWPEETALALRANDQSVLATGQTLQMDETIPALDGGERIFLTLKFPFEDAVGQRFVGGVAIDVTEQRRAEAELQRQFREAERARSETAAVLDATAEGIMLVAPDRRVVTLNRRAVTLLGLEPAATLERPIAELRPDFEEIFEAPERTAGLICDASPTDERRFAEVVDQRWPEPRELELSSAPVRGGDGEPLGRLFAFRDVTRERALDRMKTEFVSMVSHELRTPLTSIKGYVDLMLDGDAGELDEEQREFLGIVRANAQRLVALINDLLDISRIEAGKIELKPSVVDLRDLVESVVASFKPQLEAKAQRLRLDLPAELPPIWGDPDRVAQILANLLSNAHKYTPRGAVIRIGAERQGRFVRIDVQDSGIGLSREEQGKLFTKFFRADNTTTQEVGGTGLGLVITRSLVQMHGGTIEVVSAPGKGATFSFTLPVARSETAELALPEEGAPVGGRVLVVEDEPDIAHLIRRYLERARHEVVIAPTAAAARCLAREERPDLITLDVMLPDGDGFALLEELKGEAATREIPVIVVSMVGDEHHGRLLGAADFLVKPVQEKDLVQRVAAALRGVREGGDLAVAGEER